MADDELGPPVPTMAELVLVASGTEAHRIPPVSQRVVRTKRQGDLWDSKQGDIDMVDGG